MSVLTEMHFEKNKLDCFYIRFYIPTLSRLRKSCHDLFSVIYFSFLILLVFTNTAPASVEIIVAAGDATVHNQQQDNPNNPGVPIEKIGSGDLISLNSIYTGTTTVSEGRWFAMGPLGTAANTNINIANEATLGGTGPIAGAIQNSGTIAPSAGGITAGNISIPVGTMTIINGTVNQTSTGSIHVNCTPIISDKVRIVGAATFHPSSAINITPLPGYYPFTPTTYTIIDWDSYSGIPTVTSTDPKVPVSATTMGPSGLSVSLTGTPEMLPTSAPGAGGTATADVTSFAAITGNSAVVPANTTLANSVVGQQIITVPVAFIGTSTVSTSANAKTIFSQPVVTSQNDQIILTGAGITTFSADNSATLQCDINVSGSTVQITNDANLGTGQLNLTSASGTPSTLNLGVNSGDRVTLNNTLNLTDTAHPPSVVVPEGGQATLTGFLVGDAPLNLTGDGIVILSDTSGESNSYTGSLNVQAGTLIPAGDYSGAAVSISSGAALGISGTSGSVGAVTLNEGSEVQATSPTDGFSAESWTNSGTTYNIPVNNTGGTSRITVVNDATLTNPTFNILMTAGTYPQGVIDYNLLQAGGTLTVTGTVTLNWVNPAFGDGGINEKPITCTIGTFTKTTSGVPTNYLVLKATLTDDVTVSALQTTADCNDTIPLTTPLTTTVIASTDIVSPDSGLLETATAAPIADQVELTNLVFQNHPASDDAVSSAVGDAFRFKGFSSSKTPSVSGKKDAIETLLTALSKNGPVAYEKNETRLWVSPYANRSRTNRTNSDSGNQGWSGGSLVGVEQRDKKNIWSLGLLTGLMGSRSHVLGTPDTFSKTNGFLIGAFNTYKYTQEWGHEVLISRTNTFVDAQRYGLDRTDKQTPYYALATYKSTTDVGNAQINYLFNIIKKKVTCRLSTGITYLGTQTGKITERNAGANALSSAASTSKSSEIYTGIGLRRIWDVDKITVRTTFVYEYGYEFMKKGSGITTTTQSLTQSTAPTTFTTPNGPRQNKHYIQLNSSYLDRDTGLKFILSYSGALYKNVRNHTGMAKVEYRF
ncbi:MAG: hypothetical protein V4544_07335 [Pseudomonadota bacterium]